MAPTNIPAKTVTIHVGPSINDPSALTEFRESAAKDASNWNSLLRWHRRNRGPQWDYSTGMYHIDQGSKEYYAGVEPYVPPPEPKEDEERKSSPERNNTSSQNTRSTSDQPSGSTSGNAQPASTEATTSNTQPEPSQGLPPMPNPSSVVSSGLPPMPVPDTGEAATATVQQDGKQASPQQAAEQKQSQNQDANNPSYQQQQQQQLQLQQQRQQQQQRFAGSLPPPQFQQPYQSASSISPALLQKSP